MSRVAIIGAGIFGCSAAIELEKDFEITLFDRESNILMGASTINHLRHHLGFHYPRSKETVEEIKAARESFEREFGESVSNVFPAYYGVSKINSKTSPEEFIKFCDSSNIPYAIDWPKEEYLDRTKIGVCIKTPERVYDPDILRGILLNKIKNSSVRLRLNHKIVGGSINGKIKKLKVECANKIFEEDFDYVVNATYSNFNSFNKWFGFPRKRFQYELVELLELYLPIKEKIGLTIMDGEFSSLLPRGEKGTFTLGHVNASVLKCAVSDDLDPVVVTSENKESNKDNILKRGIEDFPFLKKAVIVNSLFVTRIVKANVDATDERPSEITNYGKGIYSIFGGKVITCVNIAKSISKMIKEEDRN